MQLRNTLSILVSRFRNAGKPAVQRYLDVGRTDDLDTQAAARVTQKPRHLAGASFLADQLN
jgi:hypothetical protein